MPLSLHATPALFRNLSIERLDSPHFGLGTTPPRRPPPRRPVVIAADRASIGRSMSPTNSFGVKTNVDGDAGEYRSAGFRPPSTVATVIVFLYEDDGGDPAIIAAGLFVVSVMVVVVVVIIILVILILPVLLLLLMATMMMINLQPRPSRARPAAAQSIAPRQWALLLPGPMCRRPRAAD